MSGITKNVGWSYWWSQHLDNNQSIVMICICWLAWQGPSYWFLSHHEGFCITLRWLDRRANRLKSVLEANFHYKHNQFQVLIFIDKVNSNLVSTVQNLGFHSLNMQKSKCISDHFWSSEVMQRSVEFKGVTLEAQHWKDRSGSYIELFIMWFMWQWFMLNGGWGSDSALSLGRTCDIKLLN